MNRPLAPRLPVPQPATRQPADWLSSAGLRTVLEWLKAILVLCQTLLIRGMIGHCRCRVEGSGGELGEVSASRRRSVASERGAFPMRQQFPKPFGEMSRLGHWPQFDQVESWVSQLEVAADGSTGGLPVAVPSWLPRTAALQLTTAPGGLPAPCRPGFPTCQQPVTLASMPDRAEIWHLKLSV